MKYEFCWNLCIGAIAATILTVANNPLISQACCSLAPAKFASTYIYAGEAVKDGQPVHLLCYQNAVQNLPKKGAPTGNAMLLPIPAIPGSMSQQNVVDTSKSSKILFDMQRAIWPPVPVKRHFTEDRAVTFDTSFVVFDYDIYTIVLASDANAIPKALNQVKPEKRPPLNNEIFQSYAKWYPKWTFALCCFNNKDMQKAKPLMWWYKPQDQTRLFFPALDAHNGKSPVLTERVLVDHILLASCQNIDPTAATVVYRDPLSPELKQLLPQKVLGSVLYGTLPNGDFYASIEGLRSGSLSAKRVLPPGSGG